MEFIRHMHSNRKSLNERIAGLKEQTMNSVLFPIKRLRLRAAMRIAAIAVLVNLTAVGSVAHVWAAPNIPPKPNCKQKNDRTISWVDITVSTQHVRAGR
jgi:hypothetical protein